MNEQLESRFQHIKTVLAGRGRQADVDRLDSLGLGLTLERELEGLEVPRRLSEYLAHPEWTYPIDSPLDGLPRRVIEPRGYHIIRQGDPAPAMYVLEQGVVKSEIGGPTGDYLATLIEAPAVFGLGIIDREPYEATVEAFTEIRVIPVTVEHWVKLRTDTWLFAHILRALVRQERLINETAADLAFCDNRQRVAFFLDYMFDLRKRHDLSDSKFTQSFVAAATGQTRESVGILTREMKKLGILSGDKFLVEVKVLDEERLRSLAVGRAPIRNDGVIRLTKSAPGEN